jgi:hypothetical protein
LGIGECEGLGESVSAEIGDGQGAGPVAVPDPSLVTEGAQQCGPEAITEMVVLFAPVEAEAQHWAAAGWAHEGGEVDSEAGEHRLCLGSELVRVLGQDAGIGIGVAATVARDAVGDL